MAWASVYSGPSDWYEIRVEQCIVRCSVSVKYPRFSKINTALGIMFPYKFLDHTKNKTIWVKLVVLVKFWSATLK